MSPTPKQKPGLSKQDYSTPDDFIQAVKTRLGIDEFAWDFAADAENSKAGDHYWGESINSIMVPTEFWVADCGAGWGWLNPPFSNIKYWAEHCWEASKLGARIAFLVPASVGSNWFRDFVFGKAEILFLNGRLAFISDKPKWLYPKDLMLVLYGRPPSIDIWSWKSK